MFDKNIHLIDGTDYNQIVKLQFFANKILSILAKELTPPDFRNGNTIYYRRKEEDFQFESYQTYFFIVKGIHSEILYIYNYIIECLLTCIEKNIKLSPEIMKQVNEHYRHFNKLKKMYKKDSKDITLKYKDKEFIITLSKNYGN